MARTSTYLNFPNTTEEAFLFYKSVFGTEFVDGIHRMGEVPREPGQPELSESEKNLVMHVELPIVGGHIIMGSDAPDSMGFTIQAGNNMFINLETDVLSETKLLFERLSAGGKIHMPLQKMFWGDMFASLTDKFGINWMLNYSEKTE
jgi:PhnB protein